MLDLDGDLRPVVRARAVDLPEGRERERLLVEVGEQLADGRVELVLDDPAHAIEGDRRRARRSAPSAPWERSRWKASIERSCTSFAPAPFIRPSWAPSSSVSARACASPRDGARSPCGRTTASAPRGRRDGLVHAAAQELPQARRVDVRRLGGVDEVAQHAHEAQRVVEVREVAGGGEDLQAAVGDEPVGGAPVVDRDDRIALPPDDQEGDRLGEVEAVAWRRPAGR